MVVRPAMKTLQSKHVSLSGGNAVKTGELQNETGGAAAMLTNSSTGQGANYPNYVQQLALAKELVAQDPKQVAKIVKTWVTPDGE